jgi:capsular polysaccharide biosynthesis protein
MFQGAAQPRMFAPLQVFSRAVVVLGIHGGAFGNLVFCPPGVHVIEIIPIADNRRLEQHGRGQVPELRPFYWMLAAARSLKYWNVDPTKFSFDSGSTDIVPGDALAILEKIGVIV